MSARNEGKMKKVCEAFLVDCLCLIKRFAKHSNPNFLNFCEEWKKMHFQHVFSALKTDGEIAIVTDGFLVTVKSLLLSDRPLFERIGALYILYSLYFKQPNEEFCKIRVSIEEWQRLKIFLNEMDSSGEMEQPKYIFWKLLSSHAFRFILTKSEHGFESFYDHDDDTDTFETIQSILKPQLKEICDEKSGRLAAFENAEKKYNEIKQELNKGSEIKLDIIDSVKELQNGFNNILKILNGNGKNQIKLSHTNKEGIPEKRARLRKKAFQKPIEVEKGDYTYEISLEGDLLHILTSKKTSEECVKPQKADEAFSDELPSEVLQEINK